MITDHQLLQISKSLNNESFEISNFIAVATGTLSNFLPTTTSLTGEIGTRLAVSRVRTGNIVTGTATRSGATVINTSTGDPITNVGVFSSSSGGSVLQGAVVNGVTQTTNFDIEFSFSIEPVRQ